MNESIRTSGNNLLEELIKIRTLYNESDKMPLWPYDFGIFVKFGTVFRTNIIIYIIQLQLNIIF